MFDRQLCLTQLYWKPELRAELRPRRDQRRRSPRCENRNMRFGRTLIIIGLFVLALGLVVSIGERLPIRLGRLPGDIVIRGKHSVFYFPIVTSLLISLILSVVLWLFGRR